MSRTRSKPPTDTEPPPTAHALKTVVQRLVHEVMNEGHVEVIDELYTPELAGKAREWIVPFRESFPDVHMQVRQMVADGETVAAWFVCSGTHLGVWRGHAPTGRRFRVDEVYFFEFVDGRIARARGIEDTFRRARQLGLL
jgi:predicted ester cyclase